MSRVKLSFNDICSNELHPKDPVFSGIRASSSGIPATPVEMNRLAVTSLFCRPEASLRYLRHSLECEPDQPLVREILSLLEPHLHPSPDEH